MKYYLCIHSQAAIDLHIQYAKEHNYIDKDLPFEFICGARQYKNTFTVPYVDSTINNGFSAFNKQLRQHTSLLYLLHNSNIDEFIFEQCSVFIVDNKELQIQKDIDFSCMKNGSPYIKDDKQELKYVHWIQYDIDMLSKRNGYKNFVEFYKRNFNGFDITSLQNRRMTYWKCYINNKNAYVKNMFNDMLLPFTIADNIKYYGTNLMELVLSHLYYTKYQNKINLAQTFLDSDASYYSRKIDNQNVMHYYND